jgi:N-acyl-D-amino-acid deacylase
MRRFRPLVTLPILASLLVVAPMVAAQPATPVTGLEVAAMAPYDDAMQAIMARYEIPGGSLAVARGGRLLLARGYGYADVDARAPVQPSTLFRVADVSKVVTAAAVLRLVQDNGLSLDTPAFFVLDHLRAPPGTDRDDRLADVTVRDLLTHSGGWDQGRSIDPMQALWGRRASQSTGAPTPASCETVARFMLGRKLDFGPGDGYAYSNFGYCLLELILAKTTRQSYESFVQERVLAPAGIRGMRLGASQPAGRFADETRYYDHGRSSLQPSVFDPTTFVTRPYGSFHLEAQAASEGWLATPTDLVRFVAAIEGKRGSPLLDEQSRAAMLRRPALWRETTTYYAMGWFVRPIRERNEANWYHNGSLPGTYALLVRGFNGVTWAAVFNSRPRDWETFGDELDRALWRATRLVDDWPTHDLFEQAGAANSTRLSRLVRRRRLQRGRLHDLGRGRVEPGGLPGLLRTAIRVVAFEHVGRVDAVLSVGRPGRRRHRTSRRHGWAAPCARGRRVLHGGRRHRSRLDQRGVAALPRVPALQLGLRLHSHGDPGRHHLALVHAVARASDGRRHI